MNLLYAYCGSQLGGKFRLSLPLAFDSWFTHCWASHCEQTCSEKKAHSWEQTHACLRINCAWTLKWTWTERSFGCRIYYFFLNPLRPVTLQWKVSAENLAQFLSVLFLYNNPHELRPQQWTVFSSCGRVLWCRNGLYASVRKKTRHWWKVVSIASARYFHIFCIGYREQVCISGLIFQTAVSRWTQWRNK